MKHLFRIVLTIVVLVPTFRAAPFAQPFVQTLLQNAKASELSDLMLIVQVRHAKLWYAGSRKNWSLANYELDQIKHNLDTVAQLYRNFPATTTAIDTKALADLTESVKQADEEKFMQSFITFTSGCNDCHKAAGFGFVVIRVPTASPASNQAF